MARWTLESELLERARAKNVVDAINTLGLSKEQCRSAEINCESDWTPAGSETYIYKFTVTSEWGTSAFILKAVSTPSPMGSVGEVALEWLSRRRRLEAIGVSTPRFFGVHRATILEEFIPYSIPELLGYIPTRAAEFRNQCVWLAQRVAQAGFQPRDLFRDLRSRGRDVVVVDFGADLGAFRSDADGSTVLLRLQEFALQQRWRLNAADCLAVLTAGEKQSGPME